MTPINPPPHSPLPYHLPFDPYHVTPTPLPQANVFEISEFMLVQLMYRNGHEMPNFMWKTFNFNNEIAH